MKRFTSLFVFACFTVYAHAGGTPEFVPFPADYKSSYQLYHTQNRANNKQLAELYANSIAVSSSTEAELADGSVIVMEVYKPEVDGDGKPVTGEDGLFKKAKLAAVAVMQKRSDWPEAFDASDRTGDWGYAIYDPAGNIKDNDLNCVSCHTPLAGQDYMFSRSFLK